MKARDIMTSNVISVGAETRTRDIARLMLANHISAVPVIDKTGTPIGMVSEGDLLGRDETEREAREDWWLALLAEGEPLSPEFLSSVHRPERTARDVMARPLITVDEDTDVREIARRSYIANANLEVLGARVVGRPRKPLVVGRMRTAAKLKVLVTSRVVLHLSVADARVSGRR